VPGLGHVGLDLAVLLQGNPDMLRIELGLDACVAVHTRQLCAESIPGLNWILPWYVLSGNYTFSDICERQQQNQQQQQQQQQQVHGGNVNDMDTPEDYVETALS
jgi:hypothetical protein